MSSGANDRKSRSSHAISSIIGPSHIGVVARLPRAKPFAVVVAFERAEKTKVSLIVKGLGIDRSLTDR